MSISYKKLWKLLIDKDMNKNDLREAIGVSSATIARMSKGVPVSTEVMMKICKVLDCDFGDVMAVARDGEKTVSNKMRMKSSDASVLESESVREVPL